MLYTRNHDVLRFRGIPHHTLGLVWRSMSPFKTVGKWQTPAEAGRLAAQYRTAASRVLEIAQGVSALRGNLDSWAGQARDKFFVRYDPLPGELNRFAEVLEQMASKLADSQIWVEIQEWFEEIWPHDPTR